MKKTLALVISLAVVGGGAVIGTGLMGRENWASTDSAKTFALGIPSLAEDDSQSAIDGEDLQDDEFLDQIVTTMITEMTAAASDGYGRFDPTTNSLKLHVAGQIFDVPYQMDQDISLVESPGMGPLEVHWKHDRLAADLVTPVMFFGERTGWVVELPLSQAKDVSRQVAAQQDVIAEIAAEKAELRDLLVDWGALFDEEQELTGPTLDVMFMDELATITYPRGMHPFGAATGGELSFTLADRTTFSVNFVDEDVAHAERDSIKAQLEATPQDDLFIFRDTDRAFAAMEFGGRPIVAMTKPMDDGAFFILARPGSIDGLSQMLAMVGSISKRPLSAPDFDPLTMDRETARLRLGLPTMQVGRPGDDDPLGMLRFGVEALFYPHNLMSTDPSEAFDANFLWAYRTDGEYGSVLGEEITCSVLRNRPDQLSDMHAVFAGADQQPSIPPAWYVDTPDYAFGAVGPAYHAYTIEDVSGLYLVCEARDADPLVAWLALDLHKDVPRPQDIEVSSEVLDQFRTYHGARPIGPGYFIIDDGAGTPFDNYLIDGSGTVLVETLLFSWDWDPLTHTFTAEDANDQVGLYADDGRQLLDHQYSDIGGWEALGPDLVRVREADQDLYYQISTREFVEYELE